MKFVRSLARAVGARWVHSGPRTLDSNAGDAWFARHLPDGATVLAHAPDVASGCRIARDAARPGTRILGFGSFLTVGPALEFLGPEFVGL